MSRCPGRIAVALIAALSTAVLSAQGNNGVIFSEVVHGPSLPPVGGIPMPSYLELVNVQIANPVVPPNVPIGIPGTPATIAASVNNLPAIQVQLPFLQLGGNLQPPPAAQPPFPPALPPALVVASGPFPPGVLPPGSIVVIAPALFSGPNAQLGAPFVPFDVCFVNPATGLHDRLQVGTGTAGACPGVAFNQTNTFAPATGKAIRWCYVDSNTDIDFDAGLGVSPGVSNPQMAHVNGFFFGLTFSPPLGGIPLVVSGPLTGGTLSFPPVLSRVKSVHFTNSFFTKNVTDPQFDPIINASVTMNASFIAQNPAISATLFLPGLQILNETMTITASTPAGTGTLDMPMNLSTQVAVNVGPSAGASTDIRPERIFTDNTTDAAAFVMGSPSGVMVDVIPPSTGGGNVWCEVIVYDYQGNQYRAKVKNWPPGGACGPPLLGLGTDSAGSCTLIDLCFTPGALIANLFSASPAATCGGPLFPAGGICPDPVTLFCLTPPQLGAPPFFATADAAGMYVFQIPTGTLMGLIGQTFEGIAIEYTLPGTIVQQSGVNTLTF
jgi:hypothetical protein